MIFKSGLLTFSDRNTTITLVPVVAIVIVVPVKEKGDFGAKLCHQQWALDSITKKRLEHIR